MMYTNNKNRGNFNFKYVDYSIININNITTTPLTSTNSLSIDLLLKKTYSLISLNGDYDDCSFKCSAYTA